jgi:hypothetical protein
MARFTRRALIVAGPVVLLVLRRRARAATWGRDKKDVRWFGGEARVATNPNSVFQRLSEVDKWPQMLGEVKWVKIKKRQPNWVKAELELRTFDCGSHDWEVSFTGNRTIDMNIGAPGIKARGVTMVKDGKTPAEAIVTYWLFVDVTGFVGWFVSEKDLRAKQERLAINILKDLEKTFGTAVS